MEGSMAITSSVDAKRRRAAGPAHVLREPSPEWVGEPVCGALCEAGMVQVSIVVPTLNESDSLPALLERVGPAMASRSYEVLVIDDGSRDRTVVTCAQLARRYPVRLHVRDRPNGGLGGAVLYG